jgi:chitinase
MSCDSSGFGAYRTLMQALDTRFGGQLVTADGTAGGKLDAADYAGAAAHVDFYMLMTYDYFGAFARKWPTGRAATARNAPRRGPGEGRGSRGTAPQRSP